jgi:hypothetical protein
MSLPRTIAFFNKLKKQNCANRKDQLKRRKRTHHIKMLLKARREHQELSELSEQYNKTFMTQIDQQVGSSMETVRDVHNHHSKIWLAQLADDLKKKK